MKQLKIQLVRFFTNLKYRIQAFVWKVICTSGIHTQPRWVQQYHLWPYTYYGECRNCKVKLTKDYRYDDFSGPLYDGILELDCNPTYETSEHNKLKHKHRDKEAIIRACVNMFLKDLPTNRG